MSRISIAHFWERYAERFAGPGPPEELPPELGYGAVFDHLLGELTRHDVRVAADGFVHVVCVDCPYSEDPKEDICESHIGLLKGFLKAGGRAASACKRTFTNNVCNLVFTC